jgi:hypothetical protein
MKNFLKNNWKGILFPVLILYVLLWDLLIFGELSSFTFIKVLLVSFFHVLLVLKTKYVFDSEIYQYYNQAFLLFDNSKAKKSFLTAKVSTGVFAFIYFQLILLSIPELDSFKGLFLFLLAVFGLVLFIDSIYNLYILSITKVDWTRLKVPHNLQHVRFLPPPEAAVVISAVCQNALKASLSLIAGSEMLGPMLLGGPNNLGPGTKKVASYLYSEASTVGVQTRADVMRDHAWTIDQANVANGSLPADQALSKRQTHLQIWRGK